jgi:hypothetical protein
MGTLLGKFVMLLLATSLLQGLSHMNSLITPRLCGIFFLLLLLDQEAVPLLPFTILQNWGLRVFHRPLQSLTMELH